MSIVSPPLFNTSIFNNNAFQDSDGDLTLQQADVRYLKLTGGTLSGSLSLNDELNVIRSSNGDAIKCNNGSVFSALNLATNNAHIGTTSNHNFNIQANNNNVIQCKPTGACNIFNSLEIAGTLLVDANRDITNVRYLEINRTNNNKYLAWTDNTCNAELFINASSIASIGTSTNHTFNIKSNNTDRLQILSNGNVNVVNGNLLLNGQLITASAVELNYNDITTIGTAQASKALILDSNKDIYEINKLQIGSVTSSTSDFSVLTSANARIRIGSAETTGNSITMQWTYVGNNDNSNRLSFDFFGQNNNLVLLKSGNVGIGIGTPVCKLDVSGSSFIQVANAQLLAIGNNTSYTGQGVVTSSQNVSIKASSGIWANAIFVSSDRRLKTNFDNIKDETIDDFIKNVEPLIYQRKKEKSFEIGYIAQDLSKIQDLYNTIVYAFKKDNFKKENDDDIENYEFNINYDRVCCILHKGLKKVYNKLEEIDNKIKEIDNKINTGVGCKLISF